MQSDATKKHLKMCSFQFLLGHRITKSRMTFPKQLINAYDKYPASTVELKKFTKTGQTDREIINGSESKTTSQNQRNHRKVFKKLSKLTVIADACSVKQYQTKNIC